MACANIPRQNEAEDDPSLPLLVSKKSEYVKEKSDFLPSEEVQGLVASVNHNVLHQSFRSP